MPLKRISPKTAKIFKSLSSALRTSQETKTKLNKNNLKEVSI